MPVEEDQAPAAPAAAERVYLAVPYAAKDAAKALGARWNRTAKAWYAPPGADLAEFQRWMPSAQAQTAAVAEDPRDAFAEALRAARVNAGGKMHRRAGAKLHHGRWQPGAPYGAPGCGLVIRREGFPVIWRRGRRVDAAGSV